LACSSDKWWPHPNYLFYLVHKETTKEACNAYDKESNNEAHKDANETRKDANTESLPPSIVIFITSNHQKETYNEYDKESSIKVHQNTNKESVHSSIAESIPNKQDTMKHSNALYCLHARDKIKFK
jgi:hypothetical protein